LAHQPAQCLDNLRHGFHLPVTVRWRDRELPACFVQHHMAHGAACYYRSGFDSAAVLTHDGFFSGTSLSQRSLLIWRRSSSLTDLTKPSDIGNGL
jgi:predicted NodU family carbamoyl transferase